MRTVVTLIIEHIEPLPNLAREIAREALWMDDVTNVHIQGSAVSGEMITLPVIEMPEEVKP